MTHQDLKKFFDRYYTPKNMVLSVVGDVPDIKERVEGLFVKKNSGVRLAALPGCDLVRQSPLYETEPVGPVSQGWFLNAALRLETDAEPLVLLMAVKEIERSIGRRPSLPWGPRLIDIDLLLF